ncbi:MAG: M14 family metallocarboxypeptidase [Candidatus Omnitrophica bacterium]|nr:M14 family metallocarboxypeptidase [Candidatus Omnitrophota bacterium]
MQWLGKNKDGYRGERIEIREILSDALEAARKHGWQIETLAAAPGLILYAVSRVIPTATRNIYLSTGIHGDEPAGPLAVRQLLQEDAWPAHANLWLCPCLNPTGFPLNRRENAGGIDLNRDYRHLESPEIRAHVAWLDRQPAFDLALGLHEDWETHGFYLYELNPDNRPSLAERVIAAVSRVCPIETARIIEDRPAQNGIIRPQMDPTQRPRWPEAFYLISRKTRLSYTLEAPSDFPLPTRVAALATAVNAACNQGPITPSPVLYARG